MSNKSNGVVINDALVVQASEDILTTETEIYPRLLSLMIGECLILVVVVSNFSFLYFWFLFFRRVRKI